MEYEGAEAAAASRAKLAEVTKEALRAEATSKALLMERCEGEFLELVELIPSAAMYKKKEARSAPRSARASSWRLAHMHSFLQVRVNTKLVYNQQKYNLLREESEGYAKVLTVLNNFGATALAESSAPDVVVALQSLIGCFDLDPNRVFDLVLDRRVQCRPRLARHRHAFAYGAGEEDCFAFLIPSAVWRRDGDESVPWIGLSEPPPRIYLALLLRHRNAPQRFFFALVT